MNEKQRNAAQHNHLLMRVDAALSIASAVRASPSATGPSRSLAANAEIALRALRQSLAAARIDFEGNTIPHKKEAKK